MTQQAPVPRSGPGRGRPRRAASATALAFALLAAAASGVRAQDPAQTGTAPQAPPANPAAPASPGDQPPAVPPPAPAAPVQPFPFYEPKSGAGWTFTPSLGFSGTYDDNVTLFGQGSNTATDYETGINPAAEMTYASPRAVIGGLYNGSFLLYRQLSELNSFDQRGWMQASYRVTRQVTLYAHSGLAVAPTTDAVMLSGVPFLRIGSRLFQVDGGGSVVVGPHTTLTAGYVFDRVTFDNSSPYSALLQGGYDQGVTASLTHQVNARIAIGGTYDGRRAYVANDTQEFNIQNAAGTVSVVLSPDLRIRGALGVARLTDNVGFAPPRTGPSWQLGFTRSGLHATVDAAYMRSYVPSFGIGGTVQNEEFDASLHMPLARNRLFWEGSLSYRSNASLVDNSPSLKSVWIVSTVGYAVQRWVRIEGFYARSQQDSQLAGGRIDRNQIGFQIVTSKPLRIQ